MRPETFFELGGYITYIVGMIIIVVIVFLYHLYQKLIAKMYRYMVYSNVAGIWLDNYNPIFYEQETRNFQGKRRKTDMRRFRSYSKALRYAHSIQRDRMLYNRVANKEISMH